MFLDTGNQGSEGPWIAWSARGTQDGSVPAKSFFLRDENGKRVLDVFQRGVVLDIENMKTGWLRDPHIPREVGLPDGFFAKVLFEVRHAAMYTPQEYTVQV